MSNFKRLFWLDYLKAFGIFLVVYGHSGSVNPEVGRWIYSFHMPLFFLISGYLFSDKSILSDFRPFLLKNIGAIIPPYVLFSLLGYAAWVSVGRHMGSNTELDIPIYYPILATFYGTGTPDSFCVQPIPLWFFPCLLMSRVIVFGLFRMKGFMPIILSVLLCGIGFLIPRGIALPFEFETALVAQFFLTLGIYARRSNAIYRITSRDFGIFAVALLLVGSFLATMNVSVDMRTSKFGNPILFFTSSIMISMAFTLAFRELCERSWVLAVSKATIFIFPLHILVFAALSGFYVYALGVDLSIKSNGWVGLVASVSITAALTVIYPYARRIFPWVDGISLKRS
ncbi:acyltransferase family protein [Coraliomargarita sp. W4R53]